MNSQWLSNIFTGSCTFISQCILTPDQISRLFQDRLLVGNLSFTFWGDLLNENLMKTIRIYLSLVYSIILYVLDKNLLIS